MHNITELIKSRRSVRTYDGRIIDESTKEQILSFTESIHNPFDFPVEFRFLDAKKDDLSCPVVTGTELFIAGKIKMIPDFSVAFGYSFEEFVLYAQSLGLGTVWLGGTMNRDAYEKAMKLNDEEIMPCASALGYAAEKMSLRESMMRKAIKADSRLPFEKLFFDGSFDTPLTKENAGQFLKCLEMVRLAPSAVNKQPWRIIIKSDTAHFYLKRSKGFEYTEKLDMQMIDMGIALCHFALTAKENDLDIQFIQDDPGILTDSDTLYIASYRLL